LYPLKGSEGETHPSSSFDYFMIGMLKLSINSNLLGKV